MHALSDSCMTGNDGQFRRACERDAALGNTAEAERAPARTPHFEVCGNESAQFVAAMYRRVNICCIDLIPHGSRRANRKVWTSYLGHFRFDSRE